MALNRISALIGIFFRNALRYIYFGCLSSVVRSITKIKEEFQDTFEFLQKGYQLCMNGRLDLMHTNLLPSKVSETFLLLIRSANDLYTLCNLLNTSRLARLRKKNMITCESVKRNADLFS